MTEANDSPEEGPAAESEPVRRVRGGWRDFWQLHVPLVLVLSLCTVITIIEARRAAEGVWRAWAYMFEWPLIGLFTIWIWHRYRTEGSVTKGLVERWRERVSRLGAEADGESVAGVVDVPLERVERSTQSHVPPAQPADAGQAIDADPQLQAWNAYVEDLRRREPPGAPPGQ